MTIYKLSKYFSCLLFSLSTATTQAIEFNENLKKDQSISFNFHDVRDDVQKQGDRDPYAIHTKNLTAFFDWLSTSKWNPVTLQQILDAKEGKHPLPPNAVLLTFDDGTLSNYTHVFPLLKQYKIHAVFAIVTSWIDGRNAGGETAYGKKNLVSWDQLKEMQHSGLVEFASHSDQLHQGILANPQNNLEPAAITRQYFIKENRYENDDEYYNRIITDLKISKQRLDHELNIQTNTIIWPYGAVTPESEKIAKDAGLPLSFSLGRSGINSAHDGTLKRLLVTDNATAETLKEELLNLTHYHEDLITDQKHSIQFSLDDLISQPTNDVNNNLGLFLNYVQALSVNRIFINTIQDSSEGPVTFFPNEVFPIKIDLLNRTIWQSKTRLFLSAYASIPMHYFYANPTHLNTFVQNLMKNNTGVSGLDLDFGDQFYNNFIANENAQWFEKLQHIKATAEYLSNVSTTFNIVLHGQVSLTEIPAFKQKLAYLTHSFNYININIPTLTNSKESHAWINTLKDIPQHQKNKLIVSLNIKNINQAKVWETAQNFLQELERIGIHNINIQPYTLVKAADIQKHLYFPLSENSSPLSYRNPFPEGESL